MAQDRDEFDRLVRDTTPQLLRAVFLVCRDAGRAEDVVQETWLRVARRWPRVRRMGNPAGFAYRVALNRALDEHVRASRRAEVSWDRRDPPAPDELATVEDRSELRAALSVLSPRQRAVLVLRYWEGRPEAEVADLPGCSVGTVKSTASRALATVRSALNTTDLNTAALNTTDFNTTGEKR